MVKVEQLPLWNVLTSKNVSDAQRANINYLIEYAANILDRVIETFPTYTLHNSTHAENVVHLMAELLGPRCKDLNPLEAAFLLLSSFYHDIGMVFQSEERNRLSQEPEWKIFLDKEPDAYLAVNKSPEIPLDVAEWYCRWRHSDRVYVYLNRLSDEQLKWGTTSFREELGEVCLSHNLDANALHKLTTAFRGEADLRFCAILLRLADILDFDRSRSPLAVYEHLGLSHRTDPRKVISDVEWIKHLCSEGFQFPTKRQDGYMLPFLAGPDEPGVEHDVREFLDVIDGELKQCRAVLASCSDRWRSLSLPGGIDRSNIHGNGYRYGQYRFTLDQGQIMDLLMGENLYSNPYVFIRELTQNALDASRHRRFMERARGGVDFEPKPIQVRNWIDYDGYQWVRFDDDGMGMNEDIVRNHLFKVGSSYYRTADFRAEVLRVREKTHEDFVPISRFGIGLLSCFIAGDRVEISTLRRALGGGPTEPIRLSLNGRHGFFILQTPHLPALPMPAPEQEEPGYRSEPGTSIAVRLDPRKEQGHFDLEALLKRYVACPPVPVELDGERIGGDPVIFVDQPWCEKTSVTLTPSNMKSISTLLGEELREPIHVEFLPIDLTKYSPTPELKGQVVIAAFRSTSEWHQLTIKPGVHISYDEELTGLQLQVRLNYKHEISISLPMPNSQIFELTRALQTGERSWLSHNGISIPVSRQEFYPQIDIEGGWVQGVVTLTDALRPELSVSRDRLLSLPWRFYSASGLALYRALADLSDGWVYGSWSLFRMMTSQRLLLRDLLEDEFLHLDGPWAQFPIIRTTRGFFSFQDIRRSAHLEPVEILVPEPSERIYTNWCAATLIQCGLNASVEVDKVYKSARILVEKGEPPLTAGHMLFPPLTFLPFSQPTLLWWNSIFNSKHSFPAWLLEKAPEIAKRYPGMFDQIQSALTEQSRPWFRSGGLERLNAVLGRLRELHPSVHPPKKMFLAEEDFHYD